MSHHRLLNGANQELNLGSAQYVLQSLNWIEFRTFVMVWNK